MKSRGGTVNKRSHFSEAVARRCFICSGNFLKNHKKPPAPVSLFLIKLHTLDIQIHCLKVSNTGAFL